MNQAISMKMNQASKIIPGCLVAGVLMAAGSATSASAQALSPQISVRSLTSQEVKDYALTNVQTASGLNTVAIGQPAYLDALVNISFSSANITSVTWTVTAKPPGSAAVPANSPLGVNVPTYKVADRLTTKVAGRTMLVPDLAGQYTVRATIATATAGITNLTQTITAATYVGINTCALCHSGGLLAQNIYQPWSHTLHAEAFKDAIDGMSTDHFSQSCIKCHVVGFDANTNSANGGFDDVAAQTGWMFPSVLTNGNWAAMPAALKNVANVQCENCHGPGSEHAFALGKTNVANWPRLAVSYTAGSCAQCHDSLNYHPKTAEWNNSRHAIATRSPSGPTRAACVRCHTARGFKEFVEYGGNPGGYITNTVYEAITCAACHDPHDATNPHQLRAAPRYTLPDGTTVTNAGLGALCMQCHHSRGGEVNQNITNYKLGRPTWFGGSSFGVHDSSQGDMVEGVNAVTYGKVIPSGSHSAVITNVCVGCHMQPVASSDPAFTKAGGHSFSMTYPVATNGVTNVVDKVTVCVKCHGPIETFNMVRKDYNGDGVIEGIQTEVQKLLDRLSTLLPNSTYQASGNYVADGLVKTIGRTSTQTNWQDKFLNGAYNWQFVNADASKGIHNAPFAIGVLKASIADLTGDANEDGLPDSWQIQYFGSATAANAALNASPAGDGVPNWLKYALGLDPNVAGIVLPDGVVWANASAIGGTTNTIHIYTAAEVVFDTEGGRTYQIQSVSSLGGGWQNVGSPIAGTGQSISYVTPTRSNAQQFYRVVHTP
ncbi:MAG: hypothetical protein MUF81_02870 [Verrucomicrobia bacterium]|nr:hypothetical protein [Verrucomicrobiota bacterium]